MQNQQCFNLTLVECKFTINSSIDSVAIRFNLTLVECKFLIDKNQKV